jgi:hypothetical protein
MSQLNEYYRKLQSDAESFVLDVGEDEWYDLWHTHVDWDGIGNESLEARRLHLKALFTVFERIQTQVRNYPHPYQTWVVVDEADSSQDAVYFHTKNPNTDNFPIDFSFVDWNVVCPQMLVEFVDSNRYEVGWSEYEGVVSYYVRRRPKALGEV